MNNLWQVMDQTRADTQNKDFEFDMKIIWKLGTLLAHNHGLHSSLNLKGFTCVNVCWAFEDICVTLQCSSRKVVYVKIYLITYFNVKRSLKQQYISFIQYLRFETKTFNICKSDGERHV